MNAITHIDTVAIFPNTVNIQSDNSKNVSNNIIYSHTYIVNLSYHSILNINDCQQTSKLIRCLYVFV